MLVCVASCNDDRSYDRRLGDVVWSLDEGNSQEALRAADKAVSARPDCNLAYWYRGQAREALHDCQLAIDDYDVAERLYATDPNCGSECSHSVLGRDMTEAKVGALIKLMRYSEARALLAEYAVRYNLNPRTDWYEGMMRLGSGDLETADTLFKRVADERTSTRGRDWSALRASAFTAYLRGDREEATRRISLACADHRDPAYGRIESAAKREYASLLAMLECIKAADHRGVIKSFQEGEPLAVFPQALVDEWSK
jgi:tetratricopeptide (TPR) repeat protein